MLLCIWVQKYTPPPTHIQYTSTMPLKTSGNIFSKDANKCSGIFLLSVPFLVAVYFLGLDLFGSSNTSGYGAPSAGYGAPAASYGAPAASYGAPEASYGAPAPSYAAPAPSYAAPSYAAPAAGYDAPSSGYTAAGRYYVSSFTVFLPQHPKSK